MLCFCCFSSSSLFVQCESQPRAIILAHDSQLHRSSLRIKSTHFGIYYSGQSLSVSRSDELVSSLWRICTSLSALKMRHHAERSSAARVSRISHLASRISRLKPGDRSLDSEARDWRLSRCKLLSTLQVFRRIRGFRFVSQFTYLGLLIVLLEEALETGKIPKGSRWVSRTGQQRPRTSMPPFSIPFAPQRWNILTGEEANQFFPTNFRLNEQLLRQRQRSFWGPQIGPTSGHCRPIAASALFSVSLYQQPTECYKFHHPSSRPKTGAKSPLHKT